MTDPVSTASFERFEHSLKNVFDVVTSPKGFRGNHPSFPFVSPKEFQATTRYVLAHYRAFEPGFESSFDCEMLLLKINAEYSNWLEQQNENHS